MRDMSGPSWWQLSVACGFPCRKETDGGHSPARDTRAAPVCRAIADVLKAAAYLRQSLDKSGEGAAVERQRTDALQLAKLRGWEIVRIDAGNDHQCGR